jgi:alpha-beta hydrolase superfamily lysophospholipase
VQASTFSLETRDGVSLTVHRWLPDAPAKAAVQIAHGLAEHGARYARLAGGLCNAGYAVYANDHRGHGLTAKTRADLGFFASSGGWNACIADLRAVRARIEAEHPGVPVFLMGHSLGSFMVQQFIAQHGAGLAGAVLSATSGKPPAIAAIGGLLARLERLRIGARSRSALLNAMLFGAFNKPFAPARTPFDWLSRDPAEVGKYIADPLCGFIPATQLFIDMLGGVTAAAKASCQAGIPKALPIYIFNGGRDPVADNVGQLLAAYRTAGLMNVTHKVYPEARHECLNEINRDEVTGDLIAWLDEAVADAEKRAF